MPPGAPPRRSGVRALRPGARSARALRRCILASAQIGGRLPPDAVYPLAAVGGTLEWICRPAKRRILAENLGHALGLPAEHQAVRAAVHREVVNEARRSADFLWSVVFPERAAAATRIEGLGGLRRVVQDGQGAILTGPHLGAWDVVMPVAAELAGLHVHALTDDHWIARALADVRRRAGLELVYTTEPAWRLAAVLRRGEVLVILHEVVGPAVRLVEVEMLDSRLLLPAGPAALSRLTGAPIVPFAVLPLGPRAWRIVLDEPIPPPPRRSGRTGEAATTQMLADRWTELIRADPTQWVAVDKLMWLTPPGAPARGTAPAG